MRSFQCPLPSKAFLFVICGQVLLWKRKCTLNFLQQRAFSTTDLRRENLATQYRPKPTPRTIRAQKWVIPHSACVVAIAFVLAFAVLLVLTADPCSDSVQHSFHCLLVASMTLLTLLCHLALKLELSIKQFNSWGSCLCDLAQNSHRYIHSHNAFKDLCLFYIVPLKQTMSHLWSSNAWRITAALEL